MFAIEVEYLLGRAVATDTTRRDWAEWPPHPSRLFSALVDALGDMSDLPQARSGEEALRWLESQPPPEIQASVGEAAPERIAVKYFVAINDEVVARKNVRPAPLVELRNRQERYFPAVVPADPKVVFVWPSSEPSEAQRRALRELAARVPYLGHSSSVVRVHCPETIPETTMAPSADGEWLLRVPGKGRLKRLRSVHEHRVRNASVQAPRGREVRYGRKDALSLPKGPHGPIRVLTFAEKSARFGLRETAWLTSRLRQALLSHMSFPVPEVLSGHRADGSPSHEPHLAFIPLANVSTAPGRYADGSVKGLGVVLPRSLDGHSELILRSALSRLEHLVFGRRGEVRLAERSALAAGGRTLYSLTPGRLIGPARRWTTVTPIALGRYPKPSRGVSAEAIIVDHLRELGLPHPSAISVKTLPSLWGVPPASEFHRGGIKAINNRILLHADIDFDEPVVGPLLVGAGRYMGFGLLHPLGGSS